ncbi:MAG: hypothetical protein NVSMB49_19560 [Ktedonobacteraceae bacterium]
MEYMSIFRRNVTQRVETSGEISCVSTIDKEQIDQYKAWFVKDAERNSVLNDQKKIKAYQDESLRSTTVNNQEIRLFAPFHREFSALQTFTRGQLCTFGMLACGFLLGIIFFHIGMVVVLIALISIIYLADLLITLMLSAQTLNLSVEEHIDDNLVNALQDVEWPCYTILCPLYHEAEVVPQFVQAMQKLNYPVDRLQILFLTELDDIATRLAIQSLRLPQHFSIITVPDGKPRTKPRACNYGLLQATGDYVVIFDAEDVPDPLQLKKAVIAFANQGKKTACVQAKLNFYNSEQNLLTRWFTAEYSLWFDLTLPGLQKLGVPLPLGGTSNHFRTHLLRELGAWDAYNVTEDCDLGLRMASYGYKTAVLDSTTYEEANSQFKNWIRQRSRWIKGYLQTYLVYMRHPQVYLRPERLGEFLSLQLFVGGKTGVLFINPLMWALVVCYILLRPVNLYHVLFPGPVLYMGAICLIFGNFFYIYSHLLGCMKRGHYGLVKWTLTIPIYWAMASVAAFIALQQLIFKPHYWEKTKHGLHLHNVNSMTKITVITEEVKAAKEVLQFFAKLQAKGISASQTGELVATNVSSNISVTNDDIEIELTEQIVRLRMHTSIEHIVQPMLFDDSEYDETTLRLPRVTSDFRQKLPETPIPVELEQIKGVSVSDERVSLLATTVVQLMLFEEER